MLYGRTSVNQISRFAEEIPTSLIKEDSPYAQSYDPKPKVYFHADDGYSPRASTSKPDSGFTVMKKPQPQMGGALLCEGDRVRHFTFGDGEVMSVRPMGNDVLYEVAFDRVGTKKLMGNYAKLKKL